MKPSLLLLLSIASPLSVISCSAVTSTSDSANAVSDSTNSTSDNSAIDDQTAAIDFVATFLGAPLNECTPSERYVRYTRASKELEWESCRETYSNAQPAKIRKLVHARALTDDEAAQVEQSLAQIRYSIQNEIEGYDGLTLIMTTVDRAGVSAEYKPWCNNGCPNGRKAPNAQATFDLLVRLSGEPEFYASSRPINFSGVSTIEFAQDVLGSPTNSCTSRHHNQFIRYSPESALLEWESCEEADARTERSTAALTHSRVLADTEKSTLSSSLASIVYFEDDTVDGYDGAAWTMTLAGANNSPTHYTPQCINSCEGRRKAPAIGDTLVVVQTLISTATK